MTLFFQRALNHRRLFVASPLTFAYSVKCRRPKVVQYLMIINWFSKPRMAKPAISSNNLVKVIDVIRKRSMPGFPRAVPVSHDCKKLIIGQKLVVLN